MPRKAEREWAIREQGTQDEQLVRCPIHEDSILLEAGDEDPRIERGRVFCPTCEARRDTDA